VLRIADVCMCQYTSHGHCGIFHPNDTHLYDEQPVIDNAQSVDRIARIALEYARSGADMIAPSDMMDGGNQVITSR